MHVSPHDGCGGTSPWQRNLRHERESILCSPRPCPQSPGDNLKAPAARLAAPAQTPAARGRAFVGVAANATYLGRMFSAFDFCLPTRSTSVPSGPDWLHEVKYDGLYEASRVKKFFEINIFSFPAFQEARVA